MCVIAYKKRKVKIDIQSIDLMFDQNPDGAGFALIEKDKVTISKGYFTVDDLWKDISHLQDKRLVLHFRIATSGGINVPMCHPFIVDTDIKLATSIYEETNKPVLFHNGMISHFGSTAMSDTCEFTTTILPHLPTIDAQIKALKLANTKFIYIANNEVYKIGTFYRYKGLSVSNDHFIPRHLPPKGSNNNTSNTKFSNACANTLGFGNKHVSVKSSNEDLHTALKSMGMNIDFDANGFDENGISEQEYADALSDADMASYNDNEYFYEDGNIIKKPAPFFDSTSGCYIEYDHEFDTYKKIRN